MASKLLDEIQHGPAYAEGSGASMSLLITGALLAFLGFFFRVTKSH